MGIATCSCKHMVHNPRDVFMKALQWGTNNKLNSIETEEQFLAVDSTLPNSRKAFETQEILDKTWLCRQGWLL